MTYDMGFVSRLLRLMDEYDSHDALFWRCGAQYGGGEFHTPASFFVNVNDVFWWGCADLEEITPENIAALERSYADAKAAHKFGFIYAPHLFAARVRGMRPQGACYPPEPELWPLFDACGPERPVDAGNPRPHPRDRKPPDTAPQVVKSHGIRAVRVPGNFNPPVVFFAKADE